VAEPAGEAEVKLAEAEARAKAVGRAAEQAELEAMREEEREWAEAEQEEAAAEARAEAQVLAPAPVESYQPPAWSETPWAAGFFLEVLKNGQVVEKIDVSEKAFYTFGRDGGSVDVGLQHGSISRLHAVLQHGQGGTIFVFDTSTHGTTCNKKCMPRQAYFRVSAGDVLQFGQSSRLYVVGRAEYESEHLRKLRLKLEARVGRQKEEGQEKKTSDSQSEREGKGGEGNKGKTESTSSPSSCTAIVHNNRSTSLGEEHRGGSYSHSRGGDGRDDHLSRTFRLANVQRLRLLNHEHAPAIVYAPQELTPVEFEFLCIAATRLRLQCKDLPLLRKGHQSQRKTKR
jgi:hypothetical protein